MDDEVREFFKSTVVRDAQDDRAGRLLTKAMRELSALRAECDALKHDMARLQEADAEHLAECDALRKALQRVIAEADRNTDPFIRARALLAARKEGE